VLATWWEAFKTFVTSNLGDAIIALILVIAATMAALALTNWAAKQADERIRAPEIDPERRARMRTIISTSKNTLRILITATAALAILASFGIDLTAVFAAAGIAGLAISLGAQTLIKDFFGGLIILFEDQYRVGDNISVSSVDGTVEQITLRRTNVRTADGTLFVVPNGDVRIVGNNTRDWSRATVELNLTYGGDIQKAVMVLNDAMAKAAEDPVIMPMLLEAPEILGWNQTNNVGVLVRMQAKVKPGQQWAVARHLRRIALDALQDAGIPIAQPLLQMQTAGQAK
jgi:small-conductance mechanosensitive channel